MISTSDELLDLLVSYGIAAKTYSHAPVHTVAESKDLRGEIAGLHTKNLFLRDKKRNFYLIVTEENTKIDLLSLGPKVDANGKLSFASPDALNEILGIPPGAVSLLAAVNDVEKRVAIVIDKTLLKSNQINCHPLTNTRTTSLSKSDIATFLSATGHDPRYISMS
jgi:Ala-tRNA(Pro) deacylase